MKKILVFVFVSCFTLGVFAQSAGELKNAGNEALKAKNYAEALTKYEEYFKVMEGKDVKTVFNAAYCARKIKNYDKAVKLFDQSIKNRYKVASSYSYKADAYKKLKKTPEMIATLEEGLKAVPSNPNLEKTYSIHFLKEGQKYQKTGNVVKAAQNYNKILKVTSKKYRSDALFSLGTLYFNNGAKIIQKATPLANKDKAGYATAKAKANKEFEKALASLNKALEESPNREDVKTVIAEVKKAM